MTKENNKKNKTEGLPVCPQAGSCGGCQYLHLPYQKQLARKQDQIESLLKKYGPVYPITGMENPYHYRNKTHAVFGRTRTGEIISGTYQEGTHRIVPVDSCLIENEKADAIIRDIRLLAKSFKIRIYDEDTDFGLLRHVLVRTASVTGEILVVLVVRSPIFPSKRNFVEALRKKHPEITSIVLNINDRHTSMILGEKETILYGKGYIEDELCGYRFRISSRSFYQINSVQTEKMYRKAIELAALTGKERVIDAYCGIGTIGIIASGQAREVIGVELNPDAVRDAGKNISLNHASAVRVYRGDAGEFMVGMAREKESADVLIMDPPRSGSSDAFLQAVKSLSPERIVYISCGPESLARDLKKLVSYGYRMEGAWPFDLFCMTSHVETVCLLTHS